MGVISPAPSYCHPHPNLPPSKGEGAYDNESVPELPNTYPCQPSTGEGQDGVRSASFTMKMGVNQPTTTAFAPTGYIQFSFPYVAGSRPWQFPRRREARTRADALLIQVQVRHGAINPYAMALSIVPFIYLPCRIASATRSASIITAGLMGARTRSGIMEASTTLRPSTPYTRPNWFTTARSSPSGPMRQVQEM